MTTSSKVDIALPRDPSSALHAATKQYVDAAALDAERQPGYPLSEYGLISATIPIDSLTAGGSSVTVSTHEVYRCYVPANSVITGAVCLIKTAGVTPGSTNASGYAVYTDDGATRLAISTNDYTLFTATGPRIKAFTGTVAAQSTGRFVLVSLIHSCTTAPVFFCSEALGSANFNWKAPSGTHRRGQFKTATTVFPVSLNPATYGSLDSPMLWMGLY